MVTITQTGEGDRVSPCCGARVESEFDDFLMKMSLVCTDCGEECGYTVEQEEL